MSFELDGGAREADQFINKLKLPSHAASLGGVHTLIGRPAAMLAQQVSEEEFKTIGITPGLIRLSVGLENERDLINDLEQALA